MKRGMMIISILIFITACTKNPASEPNNVAADCSGPAKSFSADVSPIINSSCASGSGCHGAGSSNGPGALSSYSQIFNARVAIRSAVVSGSMPKNGSLTTAQKNAIICWIDNGAVQN